jgi:hypothetical protein
MKIAAPVKAPQRIAHRKNTRRGKVKNRTLKHHKGAAPSHTSVPTKGSTQMIYSRGVSEKTREPRNLYATRQVGLPMRQKLSDQELHALYCPVKNAKSALFLVVCFSVVVFVSWKGLHKPPEHPDFVLLLFAILVVAMLAKWLVTFTCFRERLVLGLVIVTMVAGQVESFVPSIVSQHVETVKSGHLALSLLGLLVSLTMFVQAARSPNVRPSNAETSSPS